MRCVVLIPGALLPARLAAPVLAQVRAPELKRLLAGAALGALVTAPAVARGAVHWHWLWRRFGGATDSPVTAPYAWRALAGSVPDLIGATGALGSACAGPIWSADPVHFALARDHLVVEPLGADRLTAAEATALAACAGEHVRAAGGWMAAPDPSHWFIGFEPPWNLVATPLDAALGASVQEVWPGGPDGARWRRLLNEIQMDWHRHPVQEAREASGQRAANGLWLHGGGVFRALPAAPFASVLADDDGFVPVLRGWMLAAGRPAAPCLALADTPSPAGDALAVMTDLLAPAATESWGAWIEGLGRVEASVGSLAERVFAGGFDTLELLLTGPDHWRSVTVRRAARWHFWRRPRADALAAALTVPDRVRDSAPDRVPDPVPARSR